MPPNASKRSGGPAPRVASAGDRALGPWALPHGPFIWRMVPGPMGLLYEGILALLFPCVALLFRCGYYLYCPVPCAFGQMWLELVHAGGAATE